MDVLRHDNVPEPADFQRDADPFYGVHESQFDAVVAEELESSIAADRQKVNVSELVMST